MGRPARSSLLAVRAALCCLVIARLATSLQIDGQGGVPLAMWREVLSQEPNAHLQQLAQFSEQPNMLVRTFFSDAHKQAAQQLVAWMQDAGMESWVDAIGNVHGRVNGSDPGAPATLVGSHYDSVVDAGKFDGPLGILLGIAAVKGVLLQGLAAQGRLPELGLEAREPGTPVRVPAALAAGLLRSPVHVVGFCDEEGIRFRSTFLGSRALAGSLAKHKQLEARDAEGVSVADAMRQAGVADPQGALAGLALAPGSVRHYVEFHVEQGPVLATQGAPLGVVAGIAGQTWLNVAVEGEQGHAGAVPMELRKDAIAAAAELTTMIEATCKGLPVPGVGPGGEPQPSPHDPEQRLRCTVGRVAVFPGQTNSIARWANFSADVRCRDDAPRREVLGLLRARLEAICERRGVRCEVQQTHDAEPVHCNDGVMAALKDAVAAAQPLIRALAPPGEGAGGGADAGSADDVPVLLSGAGHDAMALTDLTKVGMVFVRALNGGISHTPEELTSEADVGAAAAALATFLESESLEAGGQGGAGGEEGRDEL